MKILLDTHTLLWSLGDTSQLSKTATQLLQDSQNEVFVSTVSVWEMAIKANIGKLQAPTNLEQYMLTQLEQRDMKLLNISLAHVAFIRNMRRFHGDPFDHLLIAQASIEQMPLLTKETVLFNQYGIQTIW